MKKILAILLTVCMVVCMIPAGGVFAAEPTNWSEQSSNATAYTVDTQTTGYDYKMVDTDNDGQADDLMEIYTAKGLAYYFNSGSTSYDAKLMKNVDMSKLNAVVMTWNFNVTNYVKTFDGNNNTISGLDNPFVAGIGSGGVVKNLTISGSTITTTISSNTAIGFIAGTNAGTISSCNAGGTVNATVTSNPKVTVGAIVGTNSANAEIKNCIGSALSYKGEATTNLVIGSIAGEIAGGTVTGCTIGSVSEGTLASGATLYKGTIAGCVSASASIISTNSTSTTVAPIGWFGSDGDQTNDSSIILTVSSSTFKGAVGNTSVKIVGKNSAFAEVTAGVAEFSVNSTVEKMNLAGTTGDCLILNEAKITELNLVGAENGTPNIEVADGSSNEISAINCNKEKPTVDRNTSGKLSVGTVTNKGTNFYNTNTNGESAPTYTTSIFGNGVIVSTSSVGDGESTVYTYRAVAQAEFAGVKYATVAEAFEKAAKIGGTVKLIDTAGVAMSLNGNSGINIEKSVTLDVNGHAITISGTYNLYNNFIIRDTAAASAQNVITMSSPTINNLSATASLQLQNGKYASDPTAYVNTTLYKITKNNSDNNYTVSPKATINLGSNTSVTVSAIADQKYTKYAITPKPVVKYGTTTLVEGTDYTLSYRYNTNIGTAYVDITGMGYYTGTKTVTFNIVGDNALTDYTIYVPTISDQSYTGTYVKPYVYVYYGGATASTAKTLLTENVHYTLSYSSNINAGTATVTITGKGIYSGSVTKTFAIKYNLSNATVTPSTTSYSYDGYAKKPAVTVKIGTRTVPATDYDVTYLNNTNVGTASVLVSAKKYGTSTGSSTAYFTISGKYGTITPEYAEYSYKTTKSDPFTIRILSNTTDGTGYSYTSSNTGVAIVSSNGTVTVNGCGKTVITVTTTGNKAYYPASANITVTVKPPTGKIGSVVSSSRGKMRVSFEKVAAAQKGTVKYQVRYSRDKDFEYGTYKTATFNSTKAEANASAKKTVSGLVSGSKYYVKVRGYLVLDDGSRVYGKWSKVKSIRIK